MSSFSFPPLSCAVALSTRSENLHLASFGLSIFAALQVSFIIMDDNKVNAVDTTPLLGVYRDSLDSSSVMESP